MNTRRKFLNGIGLLASVVGGAATAKVVIEHQVTEPKKIQEDISHLAPDSSNMLVLQGNPKKMVTTEGHSCYTFTPTEYENRVHLSVGKDDRLWIKVGETWKRVVIE